MHIYTCPYCPPSKRSNLYITKDMNTHCNCEKTIFNKTKGCEKIKYKCKEIMECKLCSSAFKITKKFLAQQKRKIKDG